MAFLYPGLYLSELDLLIVIKYENFVDKKDKLDQETVRPYWGRECPLFGAYSYQRGGVSSRRGITTCVHLVQPLKVPPIILSFVFYILFVLFPFVSSLVTMPFGFFNEMFMPFGGLFMKFFLLWFFYYSLLCHSPEACLSSGLRPSRLLR